MRRQKKTTTNKAAANTAANPAATVQALENRVLLHAVLSGGVLTVSGVSGVVNDNIRIGFGDTITVEHTNHATTQTFPAASVTRIVVNAGAGNDSVAAAFANKPITINGHDGDDRLDAVFSRSPVTINGGNGNDSLAGGDANDILNGEAGNDTIGAGFGEGADVYSGGTGIDRIDYGPRSEPMTIDLDNVADDGKAGERDNVKSDIENVGGGFGNDRITGSSAANVLDGGFGDDRLDGGAGADTINGGPDTDTVAYNTRTVSVFVDLDNVADDGASGEKDNVRDDVENIIGGSAADTLTGSRYANRLMGNGGNDTLSGLDGDDTLVGHAGRDTLRGGNGDDILIASDSFIGDILDGGLGDDLAVTDGGSERTGAAGVESFLP
jgi:Ca2+-binding RTX toxin-like protein